MAHELDGLITDPKHPLLQHPRSIPSPFGNYIVPWWLERELQRIDHGVYPMHTDVLSKLAYQLSQYAVHISREDPKMIAYTPSAAEGVRDKQVRTTLARFLTKMYPHMDDVAIAKVQADHLAELDTTIETLTGEQIVDVYLEGRNSSCMTDNSYKGFTKLNHPSLAYDAPNISMAVLRNEDGLITARCMLYTPAPDDLRYIRCYGDVVLLQKLKRAGYVAGSWIGAKFKTVNVLSEPNIFIMPYLDTNGGRGNDASCNVAVIDREIQCISLKAANGLQNLGHSTSVRPATTTNGQINLKPISSAGFTTVCPLTGIIIDNLTEATYPYWNGKQVLRVSVYALRGAEEFRVMLKGAMTGVWASKTSQSFSFRYNEYLETPETRRHLNFVQLDKDLYPDERGWFVKHNDVVLSGETYVKRADCVNVASSMGFTRMHHSKVQKGWVKLHARVVGELHYAPPGVEIVKTSTGRKVVVGCYDIQKTYTGSYEFTRNVSSGNFLGNHYYKAKHTPHISVDIPEGLKMLHDYLFNSSYSDVDVAASSLVKRYISNYVPSHKPGPSYGQSYVAGSWPSPWQYCLDHEMVREDPLAIAAKKLIERFFAEAGALDYSLDYSALPQTVVVPEPAPEVVAIPALMEQAFAEAATEDYSTYQLA